MADFVAAVRAEEAAAADRAAAIIARHCARMDAAVAQIDNAAHGTNEAKEDAQHEAASYADNDVGDPFAEDEWLDGGGCGVMSGGSGDMLGHDAADADLDQPEDDSVDNAGADAAAAAAASGSDDDGQDCVICMDTVTEAGVIECCEHVFCYDCILTWAKRTNLCPCCRKRCVRPL